jgi:hypothetical protein
MKQAILSVLIALFFALAGCSNESPNAVELTVDFSWEGMVSCIRGGNPEIRINGIPADTMVLEVKSTVSTYI